MSEREEPGTIVLHGHVALPPQGGGGGGGGSAPAPGLPPMFRAGRSVTNLMSGQQFHIELVAGLWFWGWEARHDKSLAKWYYVPGLPPVWDCPNDPNG